MPPNVRFATAADRPALDGVMRRASLAVETGEVLQSLLEEPAHLRVDSQLVDSGHVILAELNQVPVGFASFILAGSNYAELDGMFVDPPHWRRGIGRLLFDAVERELVSRQAVGIRVVAGDSAVPFYQSVGFSIVGAEKTPLGPIVPVMSKIFHLNHG